MDLFLGDSVAAKRLVSEFHENRIFKQVEPDGKMPRELTRTRALGYSAFNVKHMLEMSEMARDLDTSFYAKTSPDGRCIGAAVDYIARYLGKNPKDFFPYRQIADWDKCMEEIAWIVKWASVFDSTKGYISMFEKHSLGMADDVNQLLY